MSVNQLEAVPTPQLTAEIDAIFIEAGLAHALGEITVPPYSPLGTPEVNPSSTIGNIDAALPKREPKKDPEIEKEIKKDKGGGNNDNEKKNGESK